MRTLKEKINYLNLRPRNAPGGIKVDTFGKWLRAIRRGEDIGEIATAFLHLYCDGRLKSDSGLVVRQEEPKAVSVGDVPVAVPHHAVNCMPGTFTVKDGKVVLNLDGMFWTGGVGGVISINGVVYEYPVGKNFGNFKKRKQ